MRDSSFGDRLSYWLIIAALFVIALTMMFPFYYMFVTSFVSFGEYMRSDIILWPKEWVTDAYYYIFNFKPFIRSLGVTAGVTVVGVFMNLAFTSTMAYSLSRAIPGRRFFSFIVLFTFLFGGGLIPTYLVVKETGLIDTYWALIIPGLISAYNLIVMRQFFRNIPGELVEAALIDGASEMRIYFTIMLPLSKPALAAFGLFFAVDHWNHFFDAILYLNDSHKWTIQVILRQIVIAGEAMGTIRASAESAAFRSENPPPPETIGMAAVLVATLPIMLIYPFLQKHFAKGVMLGSLKD
jgi:putative aldouronate transport system permease protein